MHKPSPRTLLESTAEALYLPDFFAFRNIYKTKQPIDRRIFLHYNIVCNDGWWEKHLLNRSSAQPAPLHAFKYVNQIWKATSIKHCNTHCMHLMDASSRGRMNVLHSKANGFDANIDDAGWGWWQKAAWFIRISMDHDPMWVALLWSQTIQKKMGPVAHRF